MNTPLFRSTAAVAGITLALLAVPLLAMQFTQEVNWGPGDFLAAALLIFGAGMATVLVARQSASPPRKMAWRLLIVIVLAAVWAELAVGLFD